MALNSQVEVFLQAMANFPALDLTMITPAAMRLVNDNPLEAGPPIPMAQVRDLSLPLAGRAVAARLYVPEGAGELPPLTLFYHGGGWVLGSLETHDATARALARASGSAVLSVAYRLAPEQPYPVPLDDCYDALCWAAGHGPELGVDTSRLAVAGDSAGGNLAAACAIRARDSAGPPLRHQLLIYPVTDRDYSRASYRDNGGGEYFLSAQMMDWFWNHYVGDAAADAAPLAMVQQVTDLGGLPPATVYTAEYDPLRDEGMAYADKLAQFGVPVEAEIAPGMIHGFFSMFALVPDALLWIDKAGARLKQALSQ
ncbi:MAG: chloramphenicol hydrolase [Pseudomonadota bacterium]|jgi:acetyl esterase